MILAGKGKNETEVLLVARPNLLVLFALRRAAIPGFSLNTNPSQAE
jgi:hypothetical protein